MECCLVIPNHTEELAKYMFQLQQKRQSCDVSLQCKDGVIYVHKLVLMACGSPYLSEQLSGDSVTKQYEVNLQDFSVKTVCCLVQTIYTGCIKIFKENITEFTELCSILGLEKVKAARPVTSQAEGKASHTVGGGGEPHHRLESSKANMAEMEVDSTCDINDSQDHSYNADEKAKEKDSDEEMVINEKTGLLERRLTVQEPHQSKKRKLDSAIEDFTSTLLEAMSQEDECASTSEKSSGDPDQVSASTSDKSSGDPDQVSARSPCKHCNNYLEANTADEDSFECKICKETGKGIEKIPEQQTQKGKKKGKTAAQLKKVKYQQDITTAYEAVMSKQMTIREACKTYNIPDGTLRDRVNNKRPVKLKPGLNATLDEAEAKKLVSCLSTLFKLGYNYSVEEMCTLASQFVVSIGKRRHDKPLTKHWFYLFSEKYPQIKELRNQVMLIDRTQSQDVSRVSNFASFLSSSLVKYGLINRPERLYSITSTEISYSPPYAVRKVPFLKETVTLFFCANGIGEVMPPYYVFPETTTDEESLQDDCEPGISFIAEEKLFPSEIFLIFLQSNFENTSDKEHKIVLVDGHSLFVSVEVLEWAEDNNLTLVVVPADCSESKQPLEVDCREAFEKLFSEICQSNSSSKQDRSSLCKAVKQAHEKVFTVGEIKQGFRMADIV